MASASDERTILVTGASGHIGREVCRVLRDANRTILPIDRDQEGTPDVLVCDLRSKTAISRLFRYERIHTIIHLAGVLPSAFYADPLTGADVNLSASCELMRQAASARVKRVIFASSVSVYGSPPSPRALTENDPVAPDEPYGASKRVVELIGEALARKGRFEFIALRIARVVGPGIKKTSSPWRSQIFDARPRLDSVFIPFSPEAVLSLIHVEDVARVLFTLAEAAKVNSFVYNTPAEMWEVRQLKELIEELKGIRVELETGGPHGGPTCDGSRFEREFAFHLHQLHDYLFD
jgi:nucleoside-diphosphate-sugar epimerase